MESAKERFNLDSNMESPYYYLTPVSTEASHILSDAGVQHNEGGTRVIGVTVMRVDPADNTVNLAASEGPTSTLMACCLLHLEDSLVLIPPQLSCPTWTRMRRATIRYESLIPFTAPYAPLGKLEVEVTTHHTRTSGAAVSGQPAGEFESHPN